MSIFTIIIILGILALNFYLYKRSGNNKKLYLLISILSGIYILSTIFIYYNNISNGFSTGILYGDILNAHFCDEYKYFVDSEILLNHFKNGEFNLWISKQLPQYEFIDASGHPSFGNYNIFVIFLTLLRMIGINSPLDFILIKLIVFIPTAIYLYKLSRIYLNENLSLLSVSIFSLLPGFLLTNTLLMRDNIILFAIIALLYYILSKKFSFITLILLAILLVFRSYLVPVFIAAFLFTYKNDKKIIGFKDLLYLGVMVLTIYFFTNFNFTLEHSNMFFSFYQIQALQDKFASVFGTGLPMLFKLFYSTLLHIVVDPLFLSFLTSGVFYLILISLGNILGILVSGLFGIKFLFLSFKSKNPKIIYLLKFTFYFTLLNSLIIMAKDAFIINRLALMWLPLFIIILLYGVNLEKSK